MFKRGKQGLLHRISCRNINVGRNDTCDVAIIGCGIMGLNTAYQILRRAPQTKVKVIERSPGPGYGSSGASSANLRSFYTFEDMIKFSRDGRRLYRNWGDYVRLKNPSAKYTNTGILVIMPFHLNDANEMKKKFDKCELNMELIDTNDMDKRFPQINKDCGYFDNNGDIEFESESMGKRVFFYENDAGYFEPVQALNDLQQTIKEHYNDYCEFRYNSVVDNIIQSNGKVQGLNILNSNGDMDTIHTPIIVNSSGPWCNDIINKLDGLDIKLTLKPVRIQVIYKDTPELYTSEFLKDKENGVPIPIISDGRSGVYMRPQLKSKQILVSTTKEEEQRDFLTDFRLPSGADPEYRNKYLNSLYHRLEPCLEPKSSKVHSLNGIYTVCLDDVHFLIGESKLKGFYLCNGFSGHGFKCAPAVGSMLAQDITKLTLDDDTKVPISFYNPYREPYILKSKTSAA